MTVTYTLLGINARLQAVADTVDAGGSNGAMVLLANSTVVSTISLARPCGTVSGGVLTFTGTLLDTSAAGTGNITSARLQDSNGNIVATDLSVGIPLDGADVTIFNGLNSTLISAGQVVQVLAAQITGS